MRLIDADALLTTMEVKCPMENDLDSFKAGMRAVLERICDAPTVDAVRVVRCGQCKYFKKPLSPDMWGWCKKVSMDNKATVEDWFCADGERREE